MKSVFNTPPPKFSKEEASQIANDLFDIDIYTHDLVSDRDQNFLCISDKKKYILKISNPAEKHLVLEMQNEAVKFIKQNNSDLGVPLQLDRIRTIEIDGTIYYIRLLEYLDGTFLNNAKPGLPSYESLGKFLGSFSYSLVGFNHSAADREFDWDIRSTHLIYKRLNYLNSNKERNTIKYFLKKYESKVLPIKSQLRMSVIHNDGNDQNLLVNDAGETTGIIDFGDMVYTYQCSEIAVSMAYVALGKQDPMNYMYKVLTGYCSVFPLTAIELKTLIYLVCIRLCLSVTMSSWRSKLFPGNEYLYVSQNDAWEFLNKIKNDDIELWCNKLICDCES
ncbi:MAG: phosphotransferase [Candidatus Marinimicrobia bacterium]|jgi:Ser/Thr protein kinase RdoA (MazF antagonist)|nr:phosphotransferase [Candidatus Neomarinimicrobiota bacterium]